MPISCFTTPTTATLLENGRVAVSGSAAELSACEDIQAFYLGEALAA